VSTLDIFATALSVAGVQLPTDRVFDGKDITAVLQGKASSPHDFLYFWRQFFILRNQSSTSAAQEATQEATQEVWRPPRPQLAAIRHGAYKAHFYTASAMGKDLRVEHSPPLLFQVDADPAERYLLNASSSAELTRVLQAMVHAAKAHVEGIEWAYGDGLTQAVDAKYLPCCNRSIGCRCSPSNF
jgi:arylsulfatase A-like enzyme